MPLHQLAAQSRQRIEHGARAGDGDARKIGAQKGGVTLAVGRAVQYRVEVMEDFLGVQRGGGVVWAVVGGGEVKCGLQRGEEGGGKIGFADFGVIEPKREVVIDFFD